MAERKIKAIMILNMMGRPLDHLNKTFTEFLEKMKEEKFFSVVSQKTFEAKPLEESKDMYSCFAEIEVEVTQVTNLIDIIFKYMPSSIEIIEPDSVELSSIDMNDLMNSISGRLHKYDEIAKIAQMQTQQFAKKLQEVLHYKAKEKESNEVEMPQVPQIQEAEKDKPVKTKKKK